MRNYKACLFALGLSMGMVGMVYAASGVRGAKPTAAANNTTGLVHVSSTAVVVYSVLISTSGGGDYTALYDSGSVTGIVSTTFGSNFKQRLYGTGISTTTAVFNFDPPLQFNNGLVVGNNTAAINVLITYEKGRGVQGY